METVWYITEEPPSKPAERAFFLNSGGRKPECRKAPTENLARWVWNQQTRFTYNYWLVALVKGKCLST